MAGPCCCILARMDKDLEHKLAHLPPYLYCKQPDCDCGGERHFLSFNKDIRGRWVIAYVNFETECGIFAGGGFPTLSAAVEAMLLSLNAARIPLEQVHVQQLPAADPPGSAAA
jgi:hypothetical protein